MRLVLIGDAHLVADHDPHRELHRKRGFFKDAWPSFVNLLRQADAEQPDSIIFLGDLVDWFSEQNVEFALNLLSTLRTPWIMTPGNHDVAIPDSGGGKDRHDRDPHGPARSFWAGKGCDWNPRLLEENGTGVLVVDSALSTVDAKDESWLHSALDRNRVNLLVTHVPCDIPVIRRWITESAPGRDLQKYVQSGSPHLFESVLRGRMAYAFSGHVHLGSALEYQDTRFHFLEMAITTFDPNRQFQHRAEYTIVETTGGLPHVERIRMD